MDLYAAYIKERENLELLSGDGWFITWKLQDNTLFIGDMFVEQPKRNQGIGTRLGGLLKDLASGLGASAIVGKVYLDAGHGRKSLESFLNFGFKEDAVRDNEVTVRLDMVSRINADIEGGR